MKHLPLTFLCFAFNWAIGQTTAIPDANFEAQLIALGYDNNGANGNILNSDAETVSELITTRNDITNFDGLQAFKNVVKIDLGQNQFSALPLGNLTLLEELIFTENEVLASLDLSSNTRLKKLDIRSIQGINTSSMTVLDLSSNQLLEHIHIFNFQDLNDITLPQTKSLTYLYIYSNFDLVADLSFYDNLETADLGVVREKLITLTLPDVKSSLKTIRVLNGEVRDFRGLADFVNLEQILLYTSTEFIEFPVSNQLTFVQIHTHFIASPVSFAGNPQLNFLDIRSNRLETPFSLDISSNPELETLVLINNKMVELDLQGNPKLISLNAKENFLVELDLSKNTRLEFLTANDNLIANVDVRNSLGLKSIDLSDNRLKSIDLTQNGELTSLDISQNLIAGQGPDITQNTELVNLSMSNNKISFLDITNCLKLVNVNLSFNQLSGNNILEQIIQTYQSSGRPLGEETYALNDNLLTNAIPDFTPLVDGTTKNFSIRLHNNSFHFGDIESRHQQYVNYRNTVRGDGTIFKEYSYAGQSKVNIREVITTIAGQPFTLSTVVRGSQNHYTWFKDGIEIAGADDAPEYTIPDPEACESGIYHVEITSDLVPFENSEAPGTNGKNLVLVRNDLVLGANGEPTCALLVDPLNNAIAVPINSGLEWESDSGACGYVLNVGTSPGANDILADEDVGNVTTYNFPNNLPSNQQIYVRINPYFNDGTQLDCVEETFLTNDELTLPSCTTLLQPTTGSISVPIFTNILWQASNGADGYRVKIGTQPGSGDLYDFDAGNTTSFNPPNDFQENQTIYVSIKPYNTVGEAVNCAVENFSTGNDDAFLSCTVLTSPLNQSVNVDVNTSLQWAAVANAIGYRLAVGTTATGTKIFSGDVGSNTMFDFASQLPPDQDIFVTITPYDINGDSQGCTTESFRTAPVIPKPDCTTLLFPEAGSREVNPSVNVAWNGAPRASGYLLEVGTSPGVYDFFSEDVGLRTSFNFPTPLPSGSAIYIRITPYNDDGAAEDCIEQSFSTSAPVIPSCSTLLVPVNGDEDVSVGTNLSWDFVSSATGYILNVGTDLAATNIFSEDVGAVTFYDLDQDLPENSTVYVSVTAYNDEGQSTGCTVESFTTTTSLLKPECTLLLIPKDGETNVSVATNFAWQAIANADGYTLTLGTSSEASDIFDGDVGAATSFDYNGLLPENSSIYVNITPYNSEGDAVSCAEEIFTTAAEASLPDCAQLTMPMNNQTMVSIETNVAWSPASHADGYILNVGTASGASDIFSADVGRATWYNLPNDLPENSTIYVSVIAYNELGTAMDCFEEQFETTSEPSIPTCTNILIPQAQEENVNVTTNIAWGLVANADGYLLNIGTTNQGTDIFSGDVGATTWYDLAQDLPENTTIYVNIIPYNDLGEGLNCVEESFRTAAAPTIPSCTILTNPVNGSQLVTPDLTLSWNAIADVTGYRLFVGTEPGVYDLVNDLDVGIINEYRLDQALPLGAQVYVLVSPYNEIGVNSTCGPETFSTASTPLEPVPFCTDIYEPINGQSNIGLQTVLRWNPVSNSDGYYLSLGTAEGETDILDRLDVGNTTEYEVSDLPAASVIYATVNAYNAQGAPEGCSYSTFITVFDEENSNDTKFALTPNGDGLNDFWRIDGIEQHPNNVVRIFNRWGDEVFKVNGYNNLTNVFSGEANRMTSLGAGQLPTGTYFFDIQIEGEHVFEKTRGYLILKRQ